MGRCLDGRFGSEFGVNRWRSCIGRYLCIHSDSNHNTKYPKSSIVGGYCHCDLRSSRQKTFDSLFVPSLRPLTP